ncbi:MAG: hypothetical protein DRJ03_12025 [Chloroflexi bacterium]|nr:MAG: hypothetical protein DRJ03_12025 [Chloroflexota bacterium]
MFTTDYADKPEIIRAAQVCGAQVTGDLFPRWMVDKFHEEGKIEVQRVTSSRMYRVTANHNGNKHSVECHARYDD